MFPGVDKAVQALLRGQESANRLKSVLEQPRTSSVPTDPLLNSILDSFSMALSFFSNFTSSQPLPYHDSSQNKLTPVARRSPKKKSYGEDVFETYRDDSPTPLQNDGFSWRKYGQKKIKTSTHQRCYYRCGNAKDQNCNATKRVQQIQENPLVYRTTYVGKHSCEVKSFSHPNEDLTNGPTMIRFDKPDHNISDLVHPRLLSVDQQETIEEEDIDHTNTMNEEYDINELLVGDEECLANQFPPFAPEDYMFYE